MMPLPNLFLGLAFASSFIVALVGLWIYKAEKALRHRDAPPRAKSAAPVLGSIQFLLSTWQFTRRERDSVRLAKSRKSLEAIAFRLGPHPVVALFGPVARNWFFNDSALKFAVSYETFGISFFNLESSHGSDMALGEFFTLRLKRFMTAEAIAPRGLTPVPVLCYKRPLTLPASEGMGLFVSCFKKHFHALGESGTINPSDTMAIAFHDATMRHLGWREMVESEAMLKRYADLAKSLVACYGTIWLLVPSWIPTPTTFRQMSVLARLYFMVRPVVRKRQHENRREQDALQAVLDLGDDLLRITSLMAGVGFATQAGPAMTGPSALCFLGAHPYWLAKVRAEVLEATGKGELDEAGDALEALSLDDWDGRFPITSACISEAIRLTKAFFFLRSQAGPDDLVMGEHILRPNTTVVRLIQGPFDPSAF